MKFKKVMAVILAATMVVGCGVTAFAEDANGATGTGTSFDHVDKKVISVTLPTTDEANVFDYYVDPERLINDAETLADGTTQVTPNDDGVYFKNSNVTTGGTEATPATVAGYSIGGMSAVTTGLNITIPSDLDEDLKYEDGVTGTALTAGWYKSSDTTFDAAITVGIDVAADAPQGTSVPAPAQDDTITVTPGQAAIPGNTGSGYSSSSDAVKFVGKNSVDVDVTVTAAVDQTATGADKNIALVADAAALEAANDPALLMTLKVGNTEKAISADGNTSASATIAGIPGNFAVTTDGSNFVYKIRTDIATTPLTDWNETAVQLIGKTNQATVPSTGMSAPKIELTWSVAAHQESALSSTTISSASNTITVTDATVTGVTLVKANGTTAACAAGTNYTFTNGILTVQKTMLANNVGGTLRIALSTGQTEEVTIQ